MLRNKAKIIVNNTANEIDKYYKKGGAPMPLPKPKVANNWNLPNPTGEGLNNNKKPKPTAANTGVGNGNVRNNGKPKTSFWNRFSGIKLPSFGRTGGNTGGGGGSGSGFKLPSFKLPSFSFGSTNKCIATKNFIPSSTFKGSRPGFVYKTQYGVNKNGKQFPCTGYYRNTSAVIGPARGPNSTKKNNNKKAGTGVGGGSSTSAGGSSTSAGGSSTSAGGAGGTGGSVSFAPTIKVNVPQAAAQAATQALPALERSALMNAGGYQSAATAISNAGGPSTAERAINALENANGNINVAAARSGISPNALANVKKLGGPTNARRALSAVAKVTRNTTPYVNNGAIQRVAPNVYALTGQVQKKPRRKRRYQLSVAELNRVINAVKKKKLISLVAHNVTRTNIHANNNRLKPYYKRVIKAGILKTPFAKIARGHAKKLVVSAPVRRRRRITQPVNLYPYY